MYLLKKKVFTILLSAFLLGGTTLMAQNDLTKKENIKPTLYEVPLLEEQPLSTFYADKTSIEVCKCDYEKRFTIFKKDRKTLDAISNEVYHYAIMSSNAYDRKTQIRLPNWKRTKRLVSIHGFSVDIYVSSKQKNIILAFRGTDDIKDWKYANIDTDAHGQYRDADEALKLVQKEYGKNIKITTTGHSLGGGLAMHVSLGNKDIDSFVFNPSPRLFASKRYDKYNNRIVIIYESGEVLSLLRPLFNTLKKVNHEKYRFNFLGGLVIKEHSIETFARCMYASIHPKSSHYNELCKDNTLTKRP